MNVVKPGTVQGLPGHLAADTVHGGEDNPQVTHAIPRRRFQILGQHVHPLHPQRVAGNLVGRGSGGDARHDLGVGGRHDLHPARRPRGDPSAQVNLVPIVGGRVVGRGDHGPGIGTERAHGEGCDGRRQAWGKQERGAASCGNDLGDGGVEVAGPVAGITPDHHARAVDLPPQPVHESAGGSRNDGPVHPAFPSPHLAAQAGGAERERTGKPAGQLGGAFWVFNEVQHVRRGFRVGVVGGPLPRVFSDAHAPSLSTPRGGLAQRSR